MQRYRSMLPGVPQNKEGLRGVLAVRHAAHASHKRCKGPNDRDKSCQDHSLATVLSIKLLSLCDVLLHAINGLVKAQYFIESLLGMLLSQGTPKT